MYDADADEDYYYAHDHLYSPTALLDDSAAVVERIEYNAYGEADVTIVSGSGTGNEYLFTGRRLDILDGGSLKIYYYRNRYYDPATGRFLTHDPLGITPNPQKPNEWKPVGQYAHGLNAYLYGFNNPVHNGDSHGLSPVYIPNQQTYLPNMNFSLPKPKSPLKGCVCGPSVDEYLLAAVNRMIERARKLPGSETGPLDGAVFLRHNGALMDLKFDPVEGCAQGGPCKDTLMLCGTCLHKSQVNNIVFGVMAHLVGVWDGIRDAGANYIDLEHDEGSIQWASYNIGKALAKAKAQAVSEMCAAVSARKLYDASASYKYSVCGQCPHSAPKPFLDYSTDTWNLLQSAE